MSIIIGICLVLGAITALTMFSQYGTGPLHEKLVSKWRECYVRIFDSACGRRAGGRESMIS